MTEARAGHADVQVGLGQLWRRLGKYEQAVRSLRKALQDDPHHAAAHLEMAATLWDQGRSIEAIEAYRRGVAANPASAELHKGLIHALTLHSGLQAAFDEYGLVRRDDKTLEVGPQAILAYTAVRNEADRLPHFLAHYRGLGIVTFFVVDNDSSDGSLQYLLDQPDVFVWQSTLPFKRANFGAAWFELLLRAHGVGHWCLVVDADELLVYADYERRSLPQLCDDLDRQQKRAFPALLLDMYSDQPIAETVYTRGQAFLDVCPYFDRGFFHRAVERGGPYRNQTFSFGGVRQRVMGQGGPYLLSKVPLIKYGLDCIPAGGQHWTNLPRHEIASSRGCLLHFKYFSTFPERSRDEARRKQHFNAAFQYQGYVDALDASEQLTLHDPRESVRFRDSQQLAELGILRREPAADGVAEAVAPPFPRIAPPSGTARRPFWSVMVTAYDRASSLERALTSVLEQLPIHDDVQIEVVNDGAAAEIQARIAEVVQRVGAGRVSFYRHPHNVGHPHIFNVCLERVRGHWVHILHDDDWVQPGFYAALRAGIEAQPAIGAAFCRHARVDEVGARQWVSWLERDTPGLVERWLDRIAVACRLQFASIVVKRDVYTELGGFCPLVGSAFDWEMWKRIAVRYPVWYEPRVLASFYQGAQSLTHSLLQSGQQVVDSLRAIECSRAYLPADVAAELSARAREHYGLYALDLAHHYLEHGDDTAALANLREGLRCSRSQAVQLAAARLAARLPRDLVQLLEESDTPRYGSTV